LRGLPNLLLIARESATGQAETSTNEKKGEVPGPRGRIAPSILSLRHLPETERRVDLLRAA
jgi:hypothetical protein